ncbi:mitochondrial carrier domain-containing protein [Corynascus similis CBS 632.67]
MSADFWAGYISGAAGIILGNPLDVFKVRLQAGVTTSTTTTPSVAAASVSPTPTSASSSYARPFLLGTAAPVLSYGALNALLFVSYNRTEALLNQLTGTTTNGDDQARGANLATTWLAGAVGGLATWVVSTPTELVKCRVQLEIPSYSSSQAPNSLAGGGVSARAAGTSSPSSFAIAKQIFHTAGLRGLYFGGAVTAIRDSVGYGFYFWGYELCSRWIPTITTTTSFSSSSNAKDSIVGSDAMRVLLCGGLAGIITWASIFPLDVIKTRVQTQQSLLLDQGCGGERVSLLGDGERRPGVGRRKTLGAWEVAKETYREGGVRPFFRGLTVCSVRAFIVNAVQWAVYEWIMMELGQGRERREAREEGQFVAG